VIDISEQKKIYDHIYANVENYNFYDEIKNEYVDAFVKIIKGRILDAGCGAGIHLKRLLRKGYDVFGIEISEVCCKKFLQDTPHENTDILTYSKKGVKYAGLICMDVLEHIDPLHMEETVKALSLLAPKAFFGIANHSDVINSIELHLITEDSIWWVNRLAKYYKRCYVITELAYQADKKIFFMIYCDASEDKDLSLLQSQYNKTKFDNSLINNFRMVDQKVINSLERELNFKQNEINSLERELNFKQNEIDKYKTDVINLEADISTIFRSRSWRITAPIRWLKRQTSKIHQQFYKKN
jgi:2-polyprenyl-3-methyl-5-hydroxy-6-metoxy-1,4-benzoquinol methylase